MSLNLALSLALELSRLSLCLTGNLIRLSLSLARKLVCLSLSLTSGLGYRFLDGVGDLLYSYTLNQPLFLNSLK